MTDKPTLSLGVTEWRALLQANMVEAHAFTQGKTVITPEDVQSLHQHLERMKSLVMAWHLSGRPAVEPEAVVEKKKPGWPKGRSRKASSQVMQ